MRYLYILSLLLIISCQPKETLLTAQQIIDTSIVASGANKVDNSEIRFNFRDKKYSALRKTNGFFMLSRIYQKENLGYIEDNISNQGFKRVVNAHVFNVPDSMSAKYSNSVNSVHYFSVLPYGLNDKAVHKKQLLSSTLKGKEYYKIEITFSKDGGGEDFDDVFIYWIGKDDFLIDYLAYSYHTNGGGKRFRVLKEQCSKGGIRFVDYHNYKPLKKLVPLIELDKAFENNELIKVSEIILEDIEVKILE
jgi:hypothetical protein